MNALDRLRSNGLHVQANGERLEVAPASRLTDDLRTFIREHKATLLRELAGQSIYPFKNQCTPAQPETLSRASDEYPCLFVIIDEHIEPEGTPLRAGRWCWIELPDGSMRWVHDSRMKRPLD